MNNSIVGREVHILFTEVLNDGETIRETVEAFESEDDAKASLKEFADEETEWVKNAHPDWKLSDGSDTFYEAYEEGRYYMSHAIAKVVMNVIK